MFWSLILEPGKTYSSIVKESFHLSMATLDVKTAKSDNDVYPVAIEIEDEQLLLCNLSKPQNLHANLDLVFQQGTKITFSTSGKATIHLTGYCIQDDVDSDAEDYDSSEDAEEEEEEDESFKNLLENCKSEASNSKSAAKKEAKAKIAAKQTSPSKRKLEPAEVVSKKKQKGTINEEEEEDDDDEDSSLDEDELGKLVDSINDEDDDEGDMDTDSDDEVDEDEDDDSDDEGSESDDGDDTDSLADSDEDVKSKKPVAKSKKEEVKTPIQNKQNKTPVSNKKQGKNQLSNGVTPQSTKKEKNQANQATPKQDGQKTPKKGKEENASPKKQVVAGGVIIEELKQGNGPVAKPGKMVSVYYTGRFKNNNRVFDQSNQGPGFKFRLGNNEVIKGWDAGLNGMKVGSKRRITCPPAMAYGNKGSPPQIPPNSTLVFEVELKSVN